MFGVSFPELLVIFVVALLVFGPERLPEIARGLGKLMADLKRSSDALRREFYSAAYKPADDAVHPLQHAACELASIKRELQQDLSHAPQDGTPSAALPDEKGAEKDGR